MPSLSVVPKESSPKALAAVTSFPSVKPANKVPSTTTTHSNANTFQVWHHRIGHSNSRAIQTVLQLCIKSISSNSFFELCKSCSIGKSHRIHSPHSTTPHHAPFELIHTDLWGPSPAPSSGGYLYYIAFVDACTRYTWIFFLKRKSDALQAFIQFHKLIQTQFTININVV